MRDGRNNGPRHGRVPSLLAVGLCLACGSAEPPETAEEAAASAVAAKSAAAAQNRAPAIARVMLRPADPSAGERVTAEPVASDPDGDTVRFDFEWHIGGRRQSEAGPRLTIPAGSKGAQIEVKVIATDGKSQSSPALASAWVSNRAPRITSLIVDPSSEVTVQSPVTASARAEDQDGDFLEYTYTWLVNERMTQQDGNVLDPKYFKRGDRIKVHAVASDGEDESEPVVSPPLTVVNSAPRVISSPAGFDERGSFRYTVRAEDPDGDRHFRYRLLEGPAGMTVGRMSGKLAWRPALGHNGKHTVTIEVDDVAGGKTTQSFDLEVTAGSPPAPAASAPE